MAKPLKTGNIMYRPSADTLKKIDALVNAGLFKSRTDLVDSSVQRYLAWEEYLRIVTGQIEGLARSDAFVSDLAEKLLPVVREKIKERL